MSNDVRGSKIYHQLFNLLSQKYGDEVTEHHVLVVLNVATKMKEFGRKIDVFKLFEEIRNLNSHEELERWFNDHVYGDAINKRIEQAQKHDPIRSRISVNDATLDDAMSLLKGNMPHSRETDYEVAILEIEDSILRDIKNNYIERRNLRRSDGSLDRALTPNEIDKIKREATKLIKSNSDIRQLHFNNTTYKQTAMILNERSIDFKYKIEQLKEDICNTFRCTPESFDIWIDLVIEEDKRRIFAMYDDKYWDPAFEERTDIKATMKYYADVLVKSDVPKDQIIYKSKFVDSIDKVEEANVMKSKPEHRDLLDNYIDQTNYRTLRQYNVVSINGHNPFKHGYKAEQKEDIKKIIQRVRTKR